MSVAINIQNLSLENGKGGGLEDLAPELLLNIICRLPDLVSLDSLIRASPVISRLFNDYAVEITEAILSSGYICGHIRVIVRIIALVRSGTLPIRDIREFTSRVAQEALRFRVRGSREGLSPEHLAKDTKPAIIRSILATARQLTWVSLDCLKFYLLRFRAIRPDHFVDKKFKFYTKATESQDKTYIPAWQLRPKGQRFNVQDVGPPSWTEEQRVTRAFWRL